MDRMKVEEALSVVWEEREKGVFDKASISSKIKEHIGEDNIDELVKAHYILIDNSSIKFTESGEGIARDIVRRQRLAERLLIDVLEIGRKEMDSSACAFEHILSKEVEESICTLLGHPQECPHGFAIPPGVCCEKAKDLIESIVTPLSKLSAGEAGKVVYVLTRDHPQLHKLMALGIVPGVAISVHQISPSFVIQAEETQVALEEDVASQIYVKKLRANKR